MTVRRSSLTAFFLASLWLFSVSALSAAVPDFIQSYVRARLGSIQVALLRHSAGTADSVRQVLIAQEFNNEVFGFYPAFPRDPENQAELNKFITEAIARDPLILDLAGVRRTCAWPSDPRLGADPGAKVADGPWGLTALHLAVIRGDLPALKLLLAAKGADLNALGGMPERTPLDLARLRAGSGPSEIEKYLLEKGALTAVQLRELLPPKAHSVLIKLKELLVVSNHPRSCPPGLHWPGNRLPACFRPAPGPGGPSGAAHRALRLAQG
jgi:hypothetical protein